MKALHPDKIENSHMAPLAFFHKRVSTFLSPAREDCASPFITENDYHFVWERALRDYKNLPTLLSNQEWTEGRDKHVRIGLLEKRRPETYNKYFVDLTPDEMDMDPSPDQTSGVITFGPALSINCHADAAFFCPACEHDMRQDFEDWSKVNMLDNIQVTETAETQPPGAKKKAFAKTLGSTQVNKHSKKKGCYIWSLNRFNMHAQHTPGGRQRIGHTFRTLIPFYLNKTVAQSPLEYPRNKRQFKIDHLATIIQNRFENALTLTWKGSGPLPLKRLIIELSEAENGAIRSHWMAHGTVFEEKDKTMALTLYLQELLRKLRDAMVTELKGRRLQEDLQQTTAANFVNNFNAIFTGKNFFWEHNVILPSAKDFLPGGNGD
jgi:hypothetical protein